MQSSLEDIQKQAQKSKIVPYVLSIPTDTLTPISAFLRLTQTNNNQSFLLESITSGETSARYSFLGIDPFETLRVKNGTVSIKHGLHTHEEVGNPFDVISQRFDQYRASVSPNLPPMQGGAVGYIGYDSIKYLEDIPMPQAQAEHNEASLMFFQNIIAFDHLKHRVLIIVNIFTDDVDSLEEGYEQAKQTANELKKQMVVPTAADAPFLFPLELDDVTPLPGVMGKEKYCEAVKKIKHYIREGDIFQCVLSERFQAEINVHPFTIYRVLRTLNPSPYLFYLNTGDEVLLGASPEMLLQASGKTIQTCPIAGTRPRGKDMKEDKKYEKSLLASSKEKAEHLMLVDLGRNDIGRVAEAGSVKVTEFMQVHRFSHVMHLVSLVEGQLAKGKTSWDAFKSCFPAGTLSGAPKIRAMEIISELEPIRRETYGGAVIYHSFSGQFDSCITIRSLLVRDKKGFVQAGAGVVADSNPEREYEEAINKSKALLKAIEIAHGNEANL